MRSSDDRDLVGHFGCVNAVEFSTDGTTLASGGDDKRLLVSGGRKNCSSCNNKDCYMNRCDVICLRVRALRGQ